MRKVRKVSISTYISVRVVGIVLMMAVMMMIFITYFSNKMIRNDILNQLMSVSRHDKDNIKIKNNQIQIKDRFLYEDDEIVKIVLTEEGKVVGGKYPDQDLEFVPIEKLKMREIKCNSEKYFLYDRFIDKWNKDEKKSDTIIIRSVVNKTDITSKYRMLQYISYVGIVVFMAASVAMVLLICVKITEPMKLICETAEKIGQEKDLSKRMEYNGQFIDIDILTQANNRMLDKLEKMFEQQIQFNSDVAHELRTPVSVVLAECQYARKHMNNKEEFDEAVSLIEKQVKKTNKIITQLLYLSRLDQNYVHTNFEIIDLNEMIECICENEMIKDSKNIKINVFLEEIKAYVDVNLIMIAMRNLINNAIKYSEENSSIEIYLKRENSNIVFMVRDYGCGMSEEDQKYIFNRFYRGDKARNSRGYGLGLSIALKIVQMHQGEIKVESQEGEGSTFKIYLPEIQEDNRE